MIATHEGVGELVRESPIPVEEEDLVGIGKRESPIVGIHTSGAACPAARVGIVSQRVGIRHDRTLGDSPRPSNPRCVSNRSLRGLRERPRRRPTS